VVKEHVGFEEAEGLEANGVVMANEQGGGGEVRRCESEGIGVVRRHETEVGDAVKEREMGGFEEAEGLQAMEVVKVNEMEAKRRPQASDLKPWRLLMVNESTAQQLQLMKMILPMPMKRRNRMEVEVGVEKENHVAVKLRELDVSRVQRAV
jgi:hypothetical protein